MIFGRNHVVCIEQLAAAALAGNALGLRSLVQDWLLQDSPMFECPMPSTQSLELLAISAGLLELLAERTGQSPPDWTRTIGASDRPIYLLRAAAHMPRLRELCETQSPPPLRQRRVFAPPNFLELV